jgi:ABC-2 type transport system ATP-binding protein
MTPAGMVGTGLVVADLSFRYPGRGAPVLEGLTFEARFGVTLGVLGANGSGKSTLLAALVAARSGRRTGQVILDRTPLRRTLVGFATQQTALYRELTVGENLRHAARLSLGRRRVGDAVEECVAEYGLAPAFDTPVHRLSSGWARIVHIAASFMHRPPVRLLDEPTTALDFETRGRLVELVRSWRSEGVVCIITSHYPEDIEEMCSAVVVIAERRIAYQGGLRDMMTGHDSELLLQYGDGRRGDGAVRIPAPCRVGDLPGAVGRLVGGSDAAGDSPLLDLRIARRTLRSTLMRDPQLKGLLDEQA